MLRNLEAMTNVVLERNSLTMQNSKGFINICLLLLEELPKKTRTRESVQLDIITVKHSKNFILNSILGKCNFIVVRNILSGYSRDRTQPNPQFANLNIVPLEVNY